MLPQISSILFESVLDFSLLEAAISTLFAFLETSLWSGSSTTRSGSRPEDELTDFIASFKLTLPKLSFAA